MSTGRNNGTIHIIMGLFIALLVMLPINGKLVLVESEDNIKMMNNTGEIVFEEEIAGFKNYQFFNKNNTINGLSGYMPEGKLDISKVQAQCLKMSSSEKDWVIILPFVNSDFLYNLNLFNLDTFKQVKGIIFTYSGNPQITSPAPNNQLPLIISFAKEEIIIKHKIEDLSFPKSEDYSFNQDHTYTQFGSVMNPAFKYYVTALCLWGFGTMMHIFWTWGVKKDYSTHLQKIILFVPIFFFGYTLIDYVYFLSGPWNEASGVQYLQIVQIALVTIFNTLFVGLCGFISKGWSIMRSSFTREELSSITIIVGIFYLVYSAYFIASDIPSLEVVIIVILIIMYIWVTITCLQNSLANIRMLKSHIAITGADEIILDALKLKKKMMIQFVFVSTLYYSNKIIYSSLYTFIKDNEIGRNLIIVNLFVELIIITIMLFIFRSRKWPEYFSLDLMYRQIGPNEDHEAIPKSVIMTAIVPAPWTTDDRKMDMVFNGVEANYFKIKNYRDPLVALVLEASEHDHYQMSKMTHTDFRSNVYSGIKFAVEETDPDNSDSD